jgi:hypothetical protein
MKQTTQEETVQTKKKSRRSSKSKEQEDDGILRIDLSDMPPVSGQPIVTFRFVGR